MGEDIAMPAAAAAGGGTPPDSRKRAKADSEAGELARVAEIVMVLSAMGKMRGGRDPTPPEKSLMAEAREKLARVCESMEPHRRKDLFTKEMAMAVVVDHGLNPPKDNIPRPPKSSIAEKVANTKKKMEETKELVVQSSPHQSQLLHVSFGVKAEGRSPLSHGAQRFVPDKASTTPPGGLQAASSGAPLPTFSPGTSLLKQSQVNEVQRCTSPLKPLASPSASCSSVRLPETVVAPVQVTPTTSASPFQANKVQHTAVKVDGAHGITVFQSSAPFIREQDPKTYAIQTIQGNHHFVQQVPHVVNLHESSVFNSHNEISKMVQRILPPKAFDQPNWTPPSTDYINKPLHCMACNNIINDVESLLVCDACEKGVHMKCLLAYQRIIPKAEWHCSNCLASTHGKPLPPKYGRVTRSTAPSRSTSSPGTIQTSLEKKTGNADVNLSSQQKMISNLKPDILTPSHACMGHSHTESITINNMTNIIAKQESVLSVTSRNSDVHKEAPPDHSDERADSATLPSSLPDSNQHKLNTGMLPCHMQQQQTPECSLETKAHSMPVGPNKSGFSIDINPASQEPNDSQIINKVEVPTDSNMSSKHTDNELNDPSNVKATSVPAGDCDTTGENMNVSQETPIETMNVSQKTTSETLHRHCSGSSSNLRTVEWIGDAVSAVEGNSYYGSCCINGFTYKLEDHVFVSSNNGKPSKLKALWEDQASGTKWAMGHDFYYPNDLPEIIPRPAIPCNDEVYGSNKAITILAESISGPCQVLPPEEFEKVRADSGHPGEGIIGLNPIFICRWFYDESNGVFQCTSL